MKEFKLLIIGLCSLIALFSCKKDEANIGATISENPNDISAEVVDSFHVKTYSTIEDSVVTSGRTSPMLGCTNSSELGLAKSSLFLSLVPDSLDRLFPSSDFKIDSFYIQFNYFHFLNKKITIDQTAMIINNFSIKVIWTS